MPAQSPQDVLHATDLALRLLHQALGDLSTEARGGAIVVRAEGDAEADGEGADPGAAASDRRLPTPAGTIRAAAAEVAVLLRRVRESRRLLQTALVGDPAHGGSEPTPHDPIPRHDVPPGAWAQSASPRGAGDVMRQQLGYASTVIAEMEQRLGRVAALLAPFEPVGGASGRSLAPTHGDHAVAAAP